MLIFVLATITTTLALVVCITLTTNPLLLDLLNLDNRPRCGRRARGRDDEAEALVREDVDLDAEVVRDKRGERITEKRASELAKDALEQVRAGRPSLSGSRKASPQIAFRVPDELQARAEAKAKARGISLSQFAREALERAVGE